MQKRSQFCLVRIGLKKIEVMDAAAHTDNIASNTILKKME
jgi:hypothetical protein